MPRKLTNNEFKTKANKIHNNFYDYSLVEYSDCFSKVKIICPKHGIFEQTAHDHLSKKGCPKCKAEKLSKVFSKTTEQFIEEANKIHNNFYDYSLVDYKNIDTKVKIICPKHGAFEQTPYKHLNGCKCPKCKSSHGEARIRNYLKENNILFEEQKHFKELGRLSYDFFVPEKNLLIEYNGIQHYEPVETFGGEEQFKKQQKNDKLKKEFAEKNNIKLLTISYKDNIVKKIEGIL